jgi:hypothetical protein
MATGFDRLVAKRRKPPPGYQHFFNEMRGGSGRQAPQQVLHDGAVSPAGTGPFRKSKDSQRLPTRTNPTPGSVRRRRNPQYN